MQPLRLYHSRSTALVTAFGGCLMTGLSLGAIVTRNEENVWPFVIGALGVFGVIVGIGRLVSRKPTIVVDDEGILIEQGIVPWEAIQTVTTSYSGIPIRLKLQLTLQSGNRVIIDLQDLSQSARRALDEIKIRLKEKRPDLAEMVDG